MSNWAYLFHTCSLPNISSSEQFQSFDIITGKALLHALRELDVDFDDSVINELLEAYAILPWYVMHLLADDC